MKYFFHPDAEEELNLAIDYYQECKLGLGYEFATEIYKTIQRVMEFPNAWQCLDDDIRRCLTNRFPFGIIYYHLSCYAYAPKAKLLARKNYKNTIKRLPCKDYNR